jgi:hypothetical protein
VLSTHLIETIAVVRGAGVSMEVDVVLAVFAVAARTVTGELAR